MKLKNVMDQLDQQINFVFADFTLNKAFEQQLKQVKAFYRTAFNAPPTESTSSNVIKKYGELIERIKKVKNGILTVNQATEEITKDTEDKRINLLIQNLLAACELLFWAGLSALFYVTCVTTGIPLMLCEPIVGAVITLSTAAFLFSSLICAIECFEQFKSFEQIDKEEVREHNLVSFFNKHLNTKHEKYESDYHNQAPTPSYT